MSELKMNCIMVANMLSRVNLSNEKSEIDD